MSNNFTKEEIKKSVEYGWRKQQAMIFLFVILIIAVITLLVVLVSCLNNILLGLQIWIGITLLYSLIFGPFVLYYLYKMRYLLKKYSKLALRIDGVKPTKKLYSNKNKLVITNFSLFSILLNILLIKPIKKVKCIPDTANKCEIPRVL